MLLSWWFSLKIKKPKVAQFLKSPLTYLFLALLLITNNLFAAIITALITVSALVLHKINDTNSLTRFLLGAGKKYNQLGKNADFFSSLIRSIRPVPCVGSIKIKVVFDEAAKESTIKLTSEAISSISMIKLHKKQLLEAVSLLRDDFVGRGAHFFHYGLNKHNNFNEDIKVDKLLPKHEVILIDSLKSYCMPQPAIVQIEMKRNILAFKPKKYQVFVLVEVI